MTFHDLNVFCMEVNLGSYFYQLAFISYNTNNRLRNTVSLVVGTLKNFNVGYRR